MVPLSPKKYTVAAKSEDAGKGSGKEEQKKKKRKKKVGEIEGGRERKREKGKKRKEKEEEKGIKVLEPALSRCSSKEPKGGRRQEPRSI